MQGADVGKKTTVGDAESGASPCSGPCIHGKEGVAVKEKGYGLK